MTLVHHNSYTVQRPHKNIPTTPYFSSPKAIEKHFGMEGGGGAGLIHNNEGCKLTGYYQIFMYTYQKTFEFVYFIVMIIIYV